jgi:hypothetical protein
MKYIAEILREVWGLFVEDSSYTLAILLWVGLVGFGTLWIPGAGAWGGPILFIGLALIMLENITRSAGKVAK